MAKYLLDLVEKTLTDNPGPTKIFCYMNFDDYVHNKGYDDILIETLTDIQNHIEHLTSNGVDVVATSDHGMAPCDVSQSRVRALEDIGGKRLCRYAVGGAGRVRWLYPHPMKEDKVVSACENLLGDGGIVLSSDELYGSGLFKGDPVSSGVGEIVLLAKDSSFPVPDHNCIFEHGSTTPDELLVPLAWWKAK